jgi:hypothetical protein
MSESNPSSAFLRLQQLYGGPDVHGMGSSVVSLPLAADGNLEGAARKCYQDFCGEIWERFGPENWLGQWAEVYRRPSGQSGNIIEELKAISDHPTNLAASMILDNIDEAEAAHAALAEVFNDPAVTQLSIFRLGDGEAYSGLLIAARKGDSDPATFLTFLMD